jgi:hypothetical protein
VEYRAIPLSPLRALVDVRKIYFVRLGINFFNIAFVNKIGTDRFVLRMSLIYSSEELTNISESEIPLKKINACESDLLSDSRNLLISGVE